MSTHILASCRAVGWSNTSVLGSDALAPTPACNELRSSTAPSESTPASINGASASTAPPAVLCTSSSTESSETVHAIASDDAPTDDTTGPPLGANADRKVGTPRPPPRNRLHTIGSTPNTDGPLGCTTADSAASPTASPIS